MFSALLETRDSSCQIPSLFIYIELNGQTKRDVFMLEVSNIYFPNVVNAKFVDNVEQKHSITLDLGEISIPDIT